ncbi:MAG: YggS family pyridoxal phosphate-dependent enzyme [Ignavibacteriae bacterium]|nr:MAG: YggS family pyridoxal phosphate-dependent enzyme [Ignavibacteriota bacterium]
MIAENIKILRKRIEQTCQKCGRKDEEVRLIAVSKTFSLGLIEEAFEAGQIEFGENYVQELQEKHTELAAKNIQWHFIGHLQSNKVKYLADYVSLIHSVDNLNLGREISKRAEQHNRIQDVLVEVHTTDEATKFGVRPEQTVGLIKELSLLTHLRICGLMTMGPFSDNPNDSRNSFRSLCDLKKQIEAEGILNVRMQHLSMGMTHDFEVAIEEGATMVRIGTAIFGRRLKNLN